MQFVELCQLIDENRGVSEVSRYLAGGGDVNAANPHSRWTLLHAAAEHQNLPLIKTLCEMGADLNAKDRAGWTPLHQAVDIDIDSMIQANKDVDAIDFRTACLLLSLGADPNAQDNEGRTPRDVAGAHNAEILTRYDRLTTGCR